MGDFLSPQRRVAKERLRSRIEEYRQRMNGCLGRYESRCNERNEQYRQDTQLLHQRWLESREKKAGKQTKTNKESNPLSEQRNLVLSQKLKRKLEASEGGSADHGPFTFNDDPVERPPLKKRPGGVDLSVQIVQQINSQPEHSQTIETNVTVSSTLKSLHGNRGNRDSPHPGGHQGLTSIRTSTSVECKQEPSDDAQCLEPQGNHSGYNSEFDDDLQALLETLEKEGGLSEDILNDLVKFDKLDDVCYKVSAETKDTGAGDSMNVGPGPPKGVSPAIAPAPSGTPTSMTQIYDVNQNMDGLQSTVPVGQFRPSSNQSQMGGIAETGPAAETLKQMAAHHQNQQPPPAYGPMKSSPMSPYPDPLHEERFLQQRNGFQSFQQQGFSTIPQQNGQNPALYPYSQQPVSLAPAKDPHLTYGRTKPLSHFPDPMGGQPTSGQPPSSLQQLQNQVRAQFSNAPTPQMQISQSQQMQITQGHHRMQMSQSQQMQMQQPPRQFSMSQQQSFNMGGNMAPSQAQFVNDPVKMQMYQEKMRQDHQQQLMEQQRRAQMQQFMNRPPPEYKMQGSVNTSPAFGVNGSMGPSPLQTMQNMVNQTNTIPGGYSQVKSEVGSINPQAVGSQVGPMGSGAPVAGSQNIHPDMVTNASPMDGYATQMQQRQQMYKQSQLAAAGQLPVTANLNRAPRPAAPTYSSSIMRNQRPPNVNVGPEGLNISQPRNPVEWHRPMLSGSGGVRPGLPHGQVNRPAAPGSIMPYTPYTNSTSGMQMQQQRTAQMTAMQGQNVVMQSNAQAMMQHRMQMSQQMVLRQAQTGSSPYPVNPAVSMSTQGSASAPGQSSHPQNYSGPVPTSAPTSVPSSAPSSQADFPLDFLDNAQTTNSDFFDSMVQSTNSSDFAILDEILGK